MREQWLVKRQLLLSEGTCNVWQPDLEKIIAVECISCGNVVHILVYCRNS